METRAAEAIRIISAFGGTMAVARLCHITPQSVSDWKKYGLPDARGQLLRVLRPDLFRTYAPKEGAVASNET